MCTHVADRNDFNQRIIEEFRANAGKVGGPFEGATLLLLHTTGAKTGQPRVNPVAYQPVADGFAVFGSKGGAPMSPTGTTTCWPTRTPPSRSVLTPYR